MAEVQYHPEFVSSKQNPAPVFVGLLQAALTRKASKKRPSEMEVERFQKVCSLRVGCPMFFILVEVHSASEKQFEWKCRPKRHHRAFPLVLKPEQHAA